MKHFLSTCIVILFYTNTISAKDVYLERHPFDIKKEHYEIPIPNVTYDEETVNIASTTEILNAHIIIRNTYGEVIYECVMDIPTTSHTIELPDYYDNEKDSIEITTEDGQTLFGYFM